MVRNEYARIEVTCNKFTARPCGIKIRISDQIGKSLLMPLKALSLPEITEKGGPLCEVQIPDDFQPPSTWRIMALRPENVGKVQT
jgi:hypothetical protein